MKVQRSQRKELQTSVQEVPCYIKGPSRGSWSDREMDSGLKRMLDKFKCVLRSELPGELL